MRYSLSGPAGRLRQTLASLAVLLTVALGSAAHAQASGSDAPTPKVPGCSPISATNAQRQLIEADIAEFLNLVIEAAKVRFEVQDCSMDGQLVNGRAIVLSARLARLPQAQRFFIIAHEYGHYQMGHQAQMSGLMARRGTPREGPWNDPGVTELAHRTEFEADAYAVRLMHAIGLNPEEAARLFDGLGEGRDNTTHPAFSRRAQSIRAVAASLPPR